MKIPFDIKYRNEVVNGQYKVLTNDGREARILCWDAHEELPIVALIDGYAWQLDKQGKTSGHGSLVTDLVIETPEPSLPELLHQAVCRAINEPNIPYSERKLYSEKLIPYIEELENCKRFMDSLQPADNMDNF